MKNWLPGLLALLAVSFFGLWPFPQRDVSELYIVESLLAEARDGGLYLRAGDVSGAGETMEEALAALEENAPGQLFLRQTRRVIFCGGTEAFGTLPAELPAGAYAYRCAAPAGTLDMETWEPILEARERRREDTPTLAQMENALLSGGRPEPAVLEAAYDPA